MIKLNIKDSNLESINISCGSDVITNINFNDDKSITNRFIELISKLYCLTKTERKVFKELVYMTKEKVSNDNKRYVSIDSVNINRIVYATTINMRNVRAGISNLIDKGLLIRPQFEKDKIVRGYVEIPNTILTTNILNETTKLFIITI